MRQCFNFLSKSVLVSRIVFLAKVDSLLTFSVFLFV